MCFLQFEDEDSSDYYKIWQDTVTNQHNASVSVSIYYTTLKYNAVIATVLLESSSQGRSHINGVNLFVVANSNFPLQDSDDSDVFIADTTTQYPTAQHNRLSSIPNCPAPKPPISKFFYDTS